MTFSYKNKSCINDVDISFKEHKITTIVGPNGCGKSTLLKLASRLLRSNDGSVLLDGKNIFDIKSKDFAKRVAILLQSNRPPSMQVYDYVMSGRYPYTPFSGRASAEDIDIVERVMKMTNCHKFADRPINKLSGGERQRVFMAMALAQDTDVIFMDEPTTFLDINVSFEFMELITTLNKTLNKTIVLVLHDLNLALNYSDYVVVMNEGKIVAHDKADDIAKKDYISKVFDVKMKKATVDGDEFYLFMPAS